MEKMQKGGCLNTMQNKAQKYTFKWEKNLEISIIQLRVRSFFTCVVIVSNYRNKVLSTWSPS